MARTVGSVNRSSIPLIKIVKEKAVAYDMPKVITSSTTAADIVMDVIGDSDRENFLVMCLDQKHKVTSCEIVAVGILNECMVHPREVFKAAILANAAAVIIAHNHPSGDPNPSEQDKTLTERLMEAGTVMGIKVLDHIIVGDKEAGRFVSLREMTNIWASRPFHC